jgi:hypothetical protein
VACIKQLFAGNRFGRLSLVIGVAFHRVSCPHGGSFPPQFWLWDRKKPSDKDFFLTSPPICAAASGISHSYISILSFLLSGAIPIFGCK